MGTSEHEPPYSTGWRVLQVFLECARGSHDPCSHASQVVNPGRLSDLVSTWRSEARTFRLYGEERLAVACERHAEQVESATAAQSFVVKVERQQNRIPAL